jgi:alpha,alpha-trehalose-phosphate synthase [UDP-forming]
VTEGAGEYDFVVVANRLPVDRVVADDGEVTWRTSPGGLVTALEPVMRQADGAWVGWSGDAGEAPEPFDTDEMRLVPVPLSEEEVSTYYEGFSNDTLWPLYHDVIAVPTYHRTWWEAYVRVNRRFAEAAAAQAAPGATVWVQDYQLQLVPAALRELRPDLKIGFFNHIPFPPYELFAQMPWRRQVVEGLLGADLLGFQRQSDANNFLRVCRRLLGIDSRRHRITVTDEDGAQREVHAAAFPISIDTPAFEELAGRESVQSRVTEVRFELGAPRKLLLGVDRLDYTKGIMHRLKAYGELLDDGVVDPEDTVFVQVATPSRERVDSYRQLRDEIELAVGRINGEHGSIGHAAVHYLHHNQPREEMSALYQAADVMLVTALRDGMNLVAKEYAASRLDERGVLVLSEFTGAADELTGSLLVNPHDISGLKRTIAQALQMDEKEQARRMRQLRRRVRTHDVTRWAEQFLAALETGHGSGTTVSEHAQATAAHP